DYAHITAPGVGIPGSWNDLAIQGGVNEYQPFGYIVEYGGLESDPSVSLSASTTIITPRIDQTISGISCGPGAMDLQATLINGVGEVFWFDAQDNLLHNGTDFTTPPLNETTTYYVMASPTLTGCFSGERLPVVATVLTVPPIHDG